MNVDKPKILIVDDLVENIEAMKRLLRNVNAELISCLSGNEALSHAIHTDFALVLLDVQMPDMNGYEVAELMHQNDMTRNVPIIFVTAINYSEDHLSQGYVSGAVDYLFKPVNKNILISKVNIFLDLYESKKKLHQEILAKENIEKALLESEERWSLALAGNNDGIWDWNIKDDKCFFSDRIPEILGIEIGLLGESFGLLHRKIHPEDRSRVNREKDLYLAGEKEYYEVEFRILCLDESYKWILERGKALWDEEKNAIRMVGSFSDITDRKTSEIKLMNNIKLTEQSNRSKSEFLANMSHELRTPLNSIMILSQVLSDNREKNLTAKQIQLSKTINSAGDNLLQIINDILDLSKIEAGRIDLMIEAVPIKELVQNMDNYFRIIIEKKGLVFEIEVDPSLPEVIYTEFQKLGQVLKNFISNSIKFTKEGKIKLLLFSTEASEDLSESHLIPAESLGISVIDSGIGIPLEKQDMIFKPFHQASSSTSREYGGTGLGLTISSKFAKLLQGEVKLESEEGVGSAFTIFIPLEYKKHKSHTDVLRIKNRKSGDEDEFGQFVLHESQDEKEAWVNKEAFAGKMNSAISEIPIDARLSDCMVLLVESDIRKVYEKIQLLEKLKMKVLTGLKSDEIVSATKAQDIFFIMMNSDFALTDGIKLLKEFRALKSEKVPPVFIYGLSENNREERKVLEDLGIEYFFSNAINPQELYEVINKSLLQIL